MGGVVITGAGGFLGRSLAAHLVGRAEPLTLITPRPDPSLSLLSGARVLVGEAHRALEDVDLMAYGALVHMATRTNPRRGSFADELRQLDELKSILEGCARAPDLDFIYPSSGGLVYGEGGSEPHREDARLAPRGTHGWGKVAAEELIHLQHREHGLRYKIVRCANPYGPGQGTARRQGLVAKLLHDLAAGERTTIWGDGQQERDYFYVADLWDLVDRFLERPEASGVFNAGSGSGTSANQLIEDIARAVGRRPAVDYEDAEPNAVRRSVLDPTRTREAWGWSASTPLGEGLRRTWESLGG